MPSCQLQRIQSLVTTASGGRPKRFWIDTLCVPQSDFRSHLQPLRTRAIESMDQVYRSASAVLVLDSELLSTQSDASLEEQLVRFACCSWSRRLWTLQEAVNGPSVLLQYSDTAVDMMSGIFQRLQTAPGFFRLSQTILTELTDFLWRIVLVKMPVKYPRITALWNACQFRSTSEDQEEAFCLAIILGLDTRPILAASQNEKWRKFLLLQRTFPKDMLFSSGPRVPHLGFRWAPQKFIGRPATTTATLSLSMGVGEASEGGLEVSARGYTFHPPRNSFHAERPCFWMVDQETQRWYRIMHRTVANDGQTPWAELRHSLSQCTNLALIINQDLENLGRALGVLVDLGKTFSAVAGTTISAGFLATVNVSLEEADHWPTLEGWRQKEATEHEAISASGDCRVVVGTPVLPEQRWCVG